ncbi:MAG: GNAT family N-acetyltransferase [Bordetella sp.]|nr:GNAT family N-acetyltransferase [Bordetella sp.]
MIVISPWNAGPDAAPPAESLTQLWLSATLATHDFLDSAMIAALYPQVRDLYLPAVEVWLAHDARGRLLGFSGLRESKVEMLFVAPAAHGQGVGTALLDHARARLGSLMLDVNEQNPRAHGFYLHYGFVETGRSPLDAAGRPFPLVHLRLP